MTLTFVSSFAQEMHYDLLHKVVIAEKMHFLPQEFKQIYWSRKLLSGGFNFQTFRGRMKH